MVFTKCRDDRTCDSCRNDIKKGDHYINKSGYNGYHVSSTCLKCVRIELDTIQQKEDQMIIETLTIQELVA